MNAPTPVLLVAGPTASGKSDLAISLARELDGEIIVVDSAQVYRGLDIGTAKVLPAQQQGVPHHLFDCIDPNEEWSVGRFREVALEKVREITARGRLPVFVGGTGLYITHLLNGLVEIPDADPTVKAGLENLTTEVLRSKIERADPIAAARIHANDRFRMVRALAVLETTGTPLSQLQQAHAYRAEDLRALILIPCWSREILYERINRRSRIMLDSGLVDETRNIVQSFGWDIRAVDFIGYAQVRDALRLEMVERESARPESPEGEMRHEALSEDIIEGIAAAISQATRRFAKRQMTFWRNEPGKRHWRTIPERTIALDQLVRDIRTRFGTSFSENEVWYLTACSALFGVNAEQCPVSFDE